jgi:cytochrome b6-f complex iron-sulfur subunit
MKDRPGQPAPDAGKRNFLKYVLGGGILAFLGTILYPILAYLKPPVQAEVEVKSVSAGKKDDLARDSGKIVKFGTKPVILVRTADDQFRAFSAVCSHLDCTVQFNKEIGMIWCACHNGKYDLTGRNVAGPPPRPLEPYKVIIQGDEILIAKNA